MNLLRPAPGESPGPRSLVLPDGWDYCVPENTRIYAIGDIHGRDDLLRSIHRMIRDDCERRPQRHVTVVYLGDYIDRGPGSKSVIDTILTDSVEDTESVALLGNHEEMMLHFLQDPRHSELWIRNGGGATLSSYGVQGRADEGPEYLRNELMSNLPAAHLEFFCNLEPMYLSGEYGFVHAGIRPGRPLEQQRLEDLVWIREEFLYSEVNHGRCIVHGHTIRRDVDIQSNRIGIDTGAFFTQMLTCLVLERKTVGILQTPPS